MSVGLNIFIAETLFHSLTIIATFSKSLALSDTEWNYINYCFKLGPGVA
jgi:hypothetical protein